MYSFTISAILAFILANSAIAGPVLRPRAATSTVTVLDTVWATAFLANPQNGGTVMLGAATVTAAGVTATGNAVMFTGGFNFADSSAAAAVAVSTGVLKEDDFSDYVNPTTATGAAVAATAAAIATSAAASTASSTESTTFLRGVNLGGWLILEKWMDSDAFSGAFSAAVDEWTFSQISGAANALNTHWNTFFTEDDIKNIAATGINALRIPIGFWAYDNTNTPYIQGADAYLEKAIGWARNAGMKVWIDCHGSPGSQNGFDNSGHEGDVAWQQDANLDRSISVLKTMAAKYGAEEFADVVVGLELVNEPISWGNNKFSVTQSWAQKAYADVKAVTANPKLVIVMHDAFEGAKAWTNLAQGLNANGTFAIDSHLYQVFDDSDNGLTQVQHIAEACSWASDLAAANSVMPTFVGEWSPATNICVNPDGSTTSGTSCSTAGCQCESDNYTTWNDAVVEQARKFVEAQLDVFESSTSGYFMWAAKGPGAWGFLNGINKGFIPNPVTSRKYPGQCGSSSRRLKRRGG